MTRRRSGANGTDWQVGAGWWQKLSHRKQTARWVEMPSAGETRLEWVAARNGGVPPRLGPGGTEGQAGQAGMKRWLAERACSRSAVMARAGSAAP
ncbi:hypothetical protein LV75_000857 [Actinokineospora diospyrosa]|uniref:Uncharacterized protein n=1 Tax=Actinokineospora diospyrosa TaxID=103728 RepID=A0ABT1I723_9PSEU|nr:hypothetical protein [Actinokineospora diospyrosa]